MRSLAVDETAAARQVDLLRHARAEHPICVGPDVDRAEPPELAPVHHAPHALNGGRSAVLWPASSFVPYCSEASTIRLASSSETAMGF